MSDFFKIGIDKQTPRVGDIGIDMSHYSTTYIFTGDHWKLIGYLHEERQTQEDARTEERRSLYKKGIKQYVSASGITMTIRPDGTEYIDKRDMPA